MQEFDAIEASSDTISHKYPASAHRGLHLKQRTDSGLTRLRFTKKKLERLLHWKYYDSVRAACVKLSGSASIFHIEMPLP